MVTLDVNSLYTSIQYQLGIDTVRELLLTSHFNDEETHFCLEYLSIIFKENYFMFADQFYQQKCGTVMGLNVALPYANAYRAAFEEKHVYPNPLY